MKNLLTILLFALVLAAAMFLGTSKATYTTEEEQHYAFLAAMLDPRLIHYKTGAFSWTTTEPVYLVQKNLVRYGGLMNDYVSGYSFTSEGENVTYLPANTIVTGLNYAAILAYIEADDVENMTDPVETYFKRKNYIQSTAPTFYKAELIQPGRNVGYTPTITINSSVGAIVKNVGFQGYQWSITASDGTTERNIIPGFSVNIGTNPNYWGHNWHNRDTMLPLSPTVDGQNYTYRARAYSDDTEYTAHVMLEVLELPSNW